jgi:O-antigen chain-terminating methyltransferase
MGEPEEIDVELIMDRIRENIRRRRTAVGEGVSPPVQRAGINPAPTEQGVEPRPYGTGGGIPPMRTDGPMAADLASLHSSYDIYHIHLTSHRKLVGSFIVFLKKLLQRLLTPFFERQVAYNATNIRVATYLKEQIDGLDQQQAQIAQVLEDKLTAYAQELQGLRGELEGRLNTANARIARIATYLKEQIDGLGQQLKGELSDQALALQGLRERIPGTERKLRRVLSVLADGQEVGEGFIPSSQAEGTAAQVELRRVPRQTLGPDFDYFGFEERFRGSQEEIKARQQIYVEYFQGKGEVMDIGCGRGEFLELLKEAGIQAKGVDIDLDMVLLCREKGLDVVRADAFAYLEALLDESLGGVFSAQVIEHLESGQIIQLVKLCHRKLRQGGILILETLNPESLLVHYKWFWMDFTHTRLIHPETLKFLFDSIGFGEVVTRFLPPPEGPLAIPPLKVQDHHAEELRRFNEATEYLNRLLYGSSDYVVIGKK